MPDIIFDARTVIGVRTPAEYAKKQARVLAQQRARGIVAAVQTVDEPIEARIEHNRWLIDCACGSGIAVHPEWAEARCLGIGCGRVYTNVVVPADRHVIEQLLAARTQHQNRNWRASESVEDLRRENNKHGVPR
jgi:hypothetical protein